MPALLKEILQLPIWRTALAFFLAPAVSPLVINLETSVRIWRVGYGISLVAYWFLSHFTAALILIAYPFSYGLGIPAYALLVILGRCSLRYILLTALVIGIIPFPFFLQNHFDVLGDLIRWGGGGALSGFAFWLIDRPDRRLSY